MALMHYLSTEQKSVTHIHLFFKNKSREYHSCIRQMQMQMLVRQHQSELYQEQDWVNNSLSGLCNAILGTSRGIHDPFLRLLLLMNIKALC